MSLFVCVMTTSMMLTIGQTERSRSDRAGGKQVSKPNRGRWEPGTSGNPAGRPSGKGQIAQLRAAIGERVPAILEKLINQATSGDVGAARLLLERVVPPLKAEELPVAFELQPGTLMARSAAILEAVAIGNLSAATGTQLIAAIASLARVTEVDELARRIDLLEARDAKP